MISHGRGGALLRVVRFVAYFGGVWPFAPPGRAAMHRYLLTNPLVLRIDNAWSGRLYCMRRKKLAFAMAFARALDAEPGRRL